MATKNIRLDSFSKCQGITVHHHSLHKEEDTTTLRAKFKKFSKKVNTDSGSKTVTGCEVSFGEIFSATIFSNPDIGLFGKYSFEIQNRKDEGTLSHFVLSNGVISCSMESNDPPAFETKNTLTFNPKS